MTRRPLIGAGAVMVAVVITLAFALGMPGPAPSGAGETPGASEQRARLVSPGPATPVPVPGHEVFGFVPYWEMNDGIAEHVARTDLTTLALFSVTHTRTGDLDITQRGYQAITGPVGERLIREARDRQVAVQLVYTSFGNAKNQRLFDSLEVQDAAIAALVDLAARTGVDGINVDVEQIALEFVPSYGAFVGRLRDALRSKLPDGEVSVATTSGPTGAAMALAASEAGADRIFLMGYDYHYAGSEVGASAPLDSRDSDRDLVWSLDLYGSMGVPVERTILGLPLYGMRWRVTGPGLGAPRLGDGAIWVPADNPGFLADPPVPPEVDPIEVVDFYEVPPDPSLPPGDDSAAAGWQAIYVDSPTTLEPKLKLADDRGLAGAGFWAIGYERGLAGYTELIARFGAGTLD